MRKIDFKTGRNLISTCRYFGLTRAEIVGRSQKKTVVQARRFFIAVSYRPFVVSSTMIMRILNKKEHSTILYAYQDHLNMLKFNANYRAEFADFCNYIGIKPEPSFDDRINNYKETIKDVLSSYMGKTVNPTLIKHIIEKL